MDSLSLEKEVLAVFAVVVKRTFDIGSDVSRKNTPEWDSLKHIELMFALEDRFGIQFSEDELAGLDSVARIVEAVRRRDAP
jgi:acyl carrier protein